MDSIKNLLGCRDHTDYNGLSLYFREASETPLLTIQEEKQLAKRIATGDDGAREHMIKANLRLVIKIAADYDGMGVPLLDLINEGNMGLMRAVERFNPSKGAKLSTYASWWIKQSIKRALANQGKIIRLPVYLVDKVAKIRRVAMKLQEELGREPTDAEVADEIGMTAERVTELITASYRPIDLNAPMEDGNDATFADVIPDEGVVTSSEQVSKDERHAVVLKLIKRLPERDRSIIIRRFGLDGKDTETLEGLGKKLHRTRERVRQIEAAALKKLRGLIEKIEARVDLQLNEAKRIGYKKLAA